jgi:glyoxylase-like metal-dependent hydrolase (beta-lactamase superfamily II)
MAGRAVMEDSAISSRTFMKRRLVLAAVMAVGALTMTVAAVQQAAGPPAPMVIEVDKLKDNLYVMKGGGGNTAVFITADGVTVVDTKLPGWGQPLLDKIRTVTNKPVTTIINTHTHFDHNSGNVEFPATVEVITHANTKTYMEQANPVYGLQTGPQPNLFKEHGGRGMPKRTFRDKMTVGRGPDQIDLYYFGRAHTGGDAFIVFPALRVMHVGDTMANRNIPIIDKNNGGSAVEFSATVAKAAQVPNVDTIINGHNPTTTTPADLRLFSEFVADFVKFAQDAKKTGKTVDDVVNTWKAPAKYTGYGMPNPMFVRSDAQVIFEETK